MTSDRLQIFGVLDLDSLENEILSLGIEIITLVNKNVIILIKLYDRVSWLYSHGINRYMSERDFKLYIQFKL